MKKLTIRFRAEATAAYIRTQRTPDVLDAIVLWNERLARVGSVARFEITDDTGNVLADVAPDEAADTIARWASTAECREIDRQLDKTWPNEHEHCWACGSATPGQHAADCGFMKS